MSREDFFTPAERAALDRATVPAPRSDLAAGIVAAALRDQPVPPRRSGRWRTHRRLLIGAGALMITSAAAATTGLFGPIPSPLPAIAAIFHPAPAVHKAPVRHAPPPARVAPTPAPTPISRTPVLDQFEAARAQRMAEGKRVLPERFVERVRARAEAMTPEQREAARARLAIRHPRIAERLGVTPPPPAEGAQPPEGFARPPLTREERIERFQRFRAFRARMRERRGLPPEPVPPAPEPGND